MPGGGEFDELVHQGNVGARDDAGCLGGVLGGGITFRFMPRALTPASIGVLLGFLATDAVLAWGLYRLFGTIRLPARQLRVWLIALHSA